MKNEDISNADKPAFPINVTVDGMTMWENGLSKRERFAMAAMQGLLSNNTITDNHDGNWIADASIKQTDELLKQLEETQ